MSGLEESRGRSVGSRDHGWGRGKESQRPRQWDHKCGRLSTMGIVIQAGEGMVVRRER